MPITHDNLENSANDTKKATTIASSLQLDDGRWIWLLFVLCVFAGVFALGDTAAELLRYDRGAIAAGGWWRLLTAHVVHLDAHHLLLNSLGMVLVWSLFVADYDAIEWCVIVSAGALAISSGLWWWSPRVAWYVGASGVLHSIMGAGTFKHLVERSWDRWILSIGLTSKLVYEQVGGNEPPLVVVDAHLYGAVCGFVVGAALWGLRSRRGSL